MIPAVSDFFDEFYPKVRRFISTATAASPEEVEDLVQETLLAAWRSRNQFREESSLATWVLGIAKNRIRGRAKSRSRGDAARAALTAIDAAPIPEDVLASVELGRMIRQALVALDETYSRLLLRRYVDGLSVPEIAAESGETAKAVESRLQRAKEALRVELKERSVSLEE